MRLLALIAVGVGFAICGAAAAADKNLVENGGFEKGLDGWKVENETGTMKVDIDSKVRAEGKASAHAAKPPATQIANDRLQIELKRLPAGKKVVVSARLKGKGLQNTWLKFFVYDAKDELVVEDCDIGRYVGTFDWREVDMTFDLPKESVRAELRLCMFLGGEAWLDEVVVKGDAGALKENVTTGDDKTAPLDSELRKWLDANATKIKTLELDASFDDLAPLAEVLKDARIVQLGENTHGDGACFEAKARLVRYLHEKLGFEVIAWESGLFECDRANELLAKGDADGAMQASVFGIWHVKPVKALFRWLAETSKTETPMTLAGFDCRWSGGLAHEFPDRLGAFLGSTDAELAPLKRLEALVGEQGDKYAPAKPDLDAGLAAWSALRRTFDDSRAKLVEKHGEAETAFFSRCLDNWRDDEAFERSKSDKSLGTWGPSNLRDAHMAANLRWLAETRYPGKKIVTWAATMHLAHGIAGITSGGVKDFYKPYTNMGQAVHEAFGGSCYTIGFAAYGGQWGSFGHRNPLARPKEGSVEDLLHRYGEPRVLIDLRRKGPFSKPMFLGPLGYGRDLEATWPTVIDGVIFIDEMTPAR